MSGAERTRRYREKFRHNEPVTKQAQPDAALARELAAAKARIAELEKEISGLQLHIRFGPKRRAAEPKAAKPPLPPDEARDREIKALKTRVRNQQAELRHLREWSKTGAAEKGGMSFATHSKIAKALHPDYQPTDAERNAGFKALTAWSSSLKGARS